MGAYSSTVDNRRQVKGGIHIQLEKTTYVSRELIQGMLYINLEEQFQGHLLQVTLEGIEETHFTYSQDTGSGNNRRPRTVPVVGLNQFLNFSIPVYDFALGQQLGYTLQPGQWKIPFQLTVIDNLPSSMNFHQSNLINCNLRYNIKADILPTDSSIRPISGAQEILIGQQVNLSQEPQTLSAESKPEICICCGGGIIKLQAQTNQRSYAPSETINISLNCDLSGYKKQVKSLHVSLEGNLIMKGHNTDRVHETNAFKKDIEITVNGRLKVNDTMTIEIPPNISLTTAGSLITLTYTVQVKPEIDTCWIETENEPLKFPIQINPTKQSFALQPYPQIPQVQQPANWNPMLLQQPQFSQEQATMIQQQQLAFQRKQTELLNQQFSGQGQIDQPIAFGINNQYVMGNQNQIKYQIIQDGQQTQMSPSGQGTTYL